MRLQGDVSGADNVLCWQTGYPFAVDMSRGYPRYNPGEFTANELLAEHNTDACLLVGAETVPYFSTPARRYLESIPTIILDYPGAAQTFTPTVYFNTGVYGIHSRGTVYRMDNVPIALQSPLSNDTPTDEFVLTALMKRC
jgi:formylmethanofuran dehydrogenase subunit B